ncbi:10025_t:CDS:2, partial [Racocetra fulgida]
MPGERDHTWIPLFGKNVVIAYGDPIDFKDILINYRAGKTDEVTTRIIITDIIFRAMAELKKKSELLEAKKFKHTWSRINAHPNIASDCTWFARTASRVDAPK